MVVAVHMVHLPNSTQYLFMERPSGGGGLLPMLLAARQ
jgi:hypothetical protein